MGISESTLFRWLQKGTVRTLKIEGIRFVDVSMFSQAAPGVSEDPETVFNVVEAGRG